MGDMYANIRKADERKPRRESWKIILPATILIMILIGLILFIPMVCKYSIHPKFTASILGSEEYAYQNDCLIVKIDGQSIHVGKENIGTVCVKLVINPPEHLGFITPDREPDLLLDFGDGSILRLWSDTILGGEEGSATRFLFEGADGSRYHFLTDNITVPDIAMPARAFQKGNTVIE